jgi:2-methylisocitrate lyase-like PEP mutase family enzyme
MSFDSSHLSKLARQLRELHQIGSPLLLVNAWDAASARQIEAAGCLAVATSSNAFAESIGQPDNNTMAPELIFDMVSRVASEVSVPVTVDVEGAYNLSAPQLVESLLTAGAVGCNIEDTDYTSDSILLDPEVQANRLAAVKAAASTAGVDLVVNARIDTFIRFPERDRAATVQDTIRRARLYLDAGADCVYPIGVSDPSLVAELVGALAAPLNTNANPTVALSALAKAGAARVSVGPQAFRAVMADLKRRTLLLLAGDVAGFAS